MIIFACFSCDRLTNNVIDEKARGPTLLTNSRVLYLYRTVVEVPSNMNIVLQNI
jgi:hypothetical protein